MLLAAEMKITRLDRQDPATNTKSLKATKAQVLKAYHFMFYYFTSVFTQFKLLILLFIHAGTAGLF